MKQQVRKGFRTANTRIEDVLDFQALEVREFVGKSGRWELHDGTQPMPTVGGISMPDTGCPSCGNKGTEEAPLIYDNGKFYWDRQGSKFGYVFQTCNGCGNRALALSENGTGTYRWFVIKEIVK